MRRIVGILSALAVTAAGLVMAAPAQASTTYTYSVNCQSGGEVSVSRTALSGDVVVLNGGTNCRRVQVSSSLVASASSVVITGGGTLTATTPGGDYRWDGSADISSVSITLQISTIGSIGLSEISTPPPAPTGTQVTVTPGSPSPAPGPSPSSDTVAPAPTLETLTLEVSTGNTTCTGGSPTGYSGSWLQLPAADACSQSGPNANPNAKLLGWATSPQFPVSVAQQIVDLKYGPIDAVIDGSRMIFIPAGGWTFVSGSNNLFPIWSS